jgi:hypothetical protein
MTDLPVLGPDGLVPLPDHISFSQVSSLDVSQPFGCALKWSFEKRVGIPWHPSIKMRLGSAFDRAVEQLFLPRAQAGGTLAVPLDLAEATATLTEQISEIVADLEYEGDDEGLAALDGTAPILLPSLELYAERHAQTPAGALQQRVTWYWQQIPVVGVIDRVDVGRLITDLKTTGTAPWNEIPKSGAEGLDDVQDGVAWKPDWVAQRRMQLAFYAVAMESEALDLGLPFEWPVPVGLDVVIFRQRQAKPNIHFWRGEVTEQDRDAARESVVAGWTVAQSGTYPANPGQACQTCSYVALCRQAQAITARPFAEIWAAVE